MKKRAILFGFLILGVIGFSGAQAADVLTPAPGSQDVTITGAQEHKNVYTAGKGVFVGSATAGDLTAAGQSIMVVGQVEQDAMLAGWSMEVTGAVGGDVRAAGNTIVINGKVGGDVIVAGGSVVISDKSEVGGDVLVAGGRVVISAPVRGSVRASGGEVLLNSEVAGAVSVRATNLTFGPNAKISNRVSYKGRNAAVSEQGAQVAGVDFTQMQSKGLRGALLALTAGAVLVKLIAWIIAGLLFIRFRKQTVERVLAEVTLSPWKKLGLGILGAIVAPLMILVCLFSFIGYYVGFILGAWFVLVLLAANLVSAIALGALVVRLLTRSVQSVVDWQAVVIGVVLWTLIGLIPIVGPIVTGILFFMVLGAFFTLSKRLIAPGSNQA